jgi:glycosyltransferase involved in cell wall biosynthesis
MQLWRRSRRFRAERGQASGIAPPKLRVWLGAHRPTRVLLINQYYWPDHASTAQHLTDLAEALAARGHECHVLCSRGGYRAGQKARPADEEHQGVHIHRLGATSLGRRNTLARMTDYLSFYAKAMARALAMPRFDVVVTLTTPPIIGLVGTALRRFKGSRHVFWSMDLHPDASIALGRMSARSPVVAALARLSDAVYRRADRVVVLGSYMADRVAAKGVRPGRIETVPVWSRKDEIYPLPRDRNGLRAELGWARKFVAMYSGNMGLAHAFDEFLEAARRLRDRKEIAFLFVGDGPRLDEVRRAQTLESLDNIRLMDYFPRERLHASLSLADVHLISMRREMSGIVVPGKLYGVMASGRPAIFIGPEHCESADTIRQADCGMNFRQGDVDGLVEALDRLAANPELAREMGERGRAFFLEEHEQEACCAQWARVIAEVAGQRSTLPRPEQFASAVRTAS